MGPQYSACQAARLPPTPWCRQTLSPPLTQGHSEKGVEPQARSVPCLWGEMGTPYYPGKCPHTSSDMDAQHYLDGGAVYQDTQHACPLGSTTHADPQGPEPRWYLSCHSAASLVHVGPIQPLNVAEGPWGQNGLGSALGFKTHCSGHRSCKAWATLTSTTPWDDGLLRQLPRCRHFYTFIILASGTAE